LSTRREWYTWALARVPGVSMLNPSESRGQSVRTQIEGGFTT
jgi:hypothetical protein